MKHVSLTEACDAAIAAASTGAGWHFHILPPECRFNSEGSYVLLVELATGPVFARSEVEPVDVVDRLYNLLFGSDRPEESLPPDSSPTADRIKLIAAAEDLTERKCDWHHHTFFPHCVLNTKPGSWTVVVEDTETKTVHEGRFDSEPAHVVRAIEEYLVSSRR